MPIDETKFILHIETVLHWDKISNNMVNLGWATCRKCGEVHCVVDNQLRVNFKTVTECINCAYKERGVQLW